MRLDVITGSGAGGRVTKRDVSAFLASAENDRSAYLSPRVRAMAREFAGASLPPRGSGAGGRITRRDLEGVAAGPARPTNLVVGEFHHGPAAFDGLWIAGAHLSALPSADPELLQRRVALDLIQALRLGTLPGDVLEAVLRQPDADCDRLVRVELFSDLSVEAILKLLQPRDAESLVSLRSSSVVVELAHSTSTRVRRISARDIGIRFVSVARPCRVPVVRTDRDGCEALGIGWTVAIVAFAADDGDLAHQLERTVGRFVRTGPDTPAFSSG